MTALQGKDGETATTGPQFARPARMTALDILRGFAVAGMILVNNPGSWVHIYPPLDHAAWTGWTPTDVVFPMFLFASGVALSLGMPRMSPSLGTFLRILRRALALIIVGLALNFLVDRNFAHLRLPGVLQRIALCYFVAAIFCLATSKIVSGERRIRPFAVFVAMVVLLVAYWALLTFVPVPGFGAGRLDSFGSLPAYVDRQVFGIAHIWKWGTTEGHGVTFDPEGLVSTIPAIASMLAGVLAGWYTRERQAQMVIISFALAGAGLIVAGQALDPWFPIIKKIWTSSFALVTTGVSLMAFAVFTLAAQTPALVRASFPLRVLGENAILAYVVSWIISVATLFPVLPSLRSGATLSVQDWGFETLGLVIPNPDAASLAYAVAMVALMIVLLTPLHLLGVRVRL